MSSQSLPEPEHLAAGSCVANGSGHAGPAPAATDLDGSIVHPHTVDATRDPRPAGDRCTPLELVSEVGDEPLDLKVVHDVVAALLVRYYHKVRPDVVSRGVA